MRGGEREGREVTRLDWTHLVLSELMEDLVHPGENLLSAGHRLGLLLDLAGLTGLTSSREEVLLFYFNLKNYGGKLAKHYYVIWNYNQLDQALFNFWPAIKQLKEKLTLNFSLIPWCRGWSFAEQALGMMARQLSAWKVNVSVWCKYLCKLCNISCFHRCKMMKRFLVFI